MDTFSAAAKVMKAVEGFGASLWLGKGPAGGNTETRLAGRQLVMPCEAPVEDIVGQWTNEQVWQKPREAPVGHAPGLYCQDRL